VCCVCGECVGMGVLVFVGVLVLCMCV